MEQVSSLKVLLIQRLILLYNAEIQGFLPLNAGLWKSERKI
jgi:hypothetical protein